MVTTTASSDVGSRAGAALRTIKKMPLIQSGLSLMVSSLVSSGLGIVFWVIAARQFSSSELGISSALITSMILLADFSHLGFRTGLVRFLPGVGPAAERLIVRSYGTTAAVAAVGAGGFVAGIHWWAPALIEVRASWWAIVLFIAATVCWVVFMLEDSVLLGVGLARWVPIENGLYGLIKIVLLAVLAGSGGNLGVFLAWAMPVFAVVAVVNGLLARNLRARGDDRPRAAQPATMGTVLSYSLNDWATAAARNVVIGVLPLLVLAQRGASATAYYILAWTIAYGVYLLSANISDALVEVSHDEGNVDRHTLRGGLASMVIAAPVVLGAVALAPRILQVFGAEYADEASTVLRLLLLGAIPNMITRTYVSRLRAERRKWAVVSYETALSFGVLALALVLLPAAGVNGLGLTWLISLMLAAVYVLIVESVWWWGPRLSTRSVHRITRVGRRITRALQRRPVVASRRVVGAVVEQLYTTRPSWRRERFSSESQTVLVAGHEGRPPVQVEVARTNWGAEILRRRVEAIAGLGELTGLASFRALLPYPIDHHTDPAPAYLVESAHSGRLGHHPIDDVPTEKLVGSVVDAIGQLHQATSATLTFDDAALDRWVSRPIRDLRKAGQIDPVQLQRVERLVCDGIAGAVVPSARLHGNLVMANTRFDPSGRLTGITGWEWSDVGPVLFDLGSLALSARTATEEVDVGAVVTDLLSDPSALFTHPAFEGYDADGLDHRAAVLACWLHALGPLIRGPVGSHRGRYWLARAVRSVVAELPDSDMDAARV